MTRTQPRDLGRTTRLHDLFALMLAACVAIVAIAAAVALLDGALPSASPGTVSSDEDTTLVVRGAPQRSTNAMHRPTGPAPRGKHR